eukprot:TRINITY_DN7020_c0_g1_i4.p1 TRINITY_DN7020_c0_g1~~TRINITY_DN7020_c0_g1_i4.p1  ORF type:complete len:137 (-),score=20.11 TRINITY_DN7020_c0_g1_i4:33-443(-)
MSWLMFQMSGLGPMQGQANVFYRYAPQKIPYAIQRYQSETKRLYTVLDKHLSKTNGGYIAGDYYSIADMALFPWVKVYRWAGIEIDDLPCLQNWLNLVGSRSAVQRGMNVPPRVKEIQAKKTEEVGKLLISSLSKL